MVIMKLKNNYGFSTVWMLVVIFILTFVIGSWANNYINILRFNKEKELIRIGLDYKKAIRSYYNNSPGGSMSYPHSLTDLTRDLRYNDKTIRYLRKVEIDPISGKKFRLVLNKDNQIIGVYSESKQRPLKQDNFPRELYNLFHKNSYDEWIF
ncbi:hypothetical protein ASC84_19980 [Acinetobacter sp. Root1280]|nr:hypothetical protein ASC84_19980 [Acinetobacter sp. Root1280]